MSEPRDAVGLDRLEIIRSAIDDSRGTVGNVDRLCTVANEVMGLSGANILLRCSRTLYTTICPTDELGNKLLDLEIACDDGPATTACTSESLVAAPELSSPEELRWLSYAPLATSAGAAAVFSFPILDGQTSFGALSFYRDTPGALTPEQVNDGCLLASVVSEAVLALEPGASMEGFGESNRIDAGFNSVVHQATGIIASQASMNVADAFVVLKFHAFAADSSIIDVADQVVAGDVYFDRERSSMCERSAEEVG